MCGILGFRASSSPCLFCKCTAAPFEAYEVSKTWGHMDKSELRRDCASVLRSSSVCC